MLFTVSLTDNKAGFTRRFSVSGKTRQQVKDLTLLVVIDLEKKGFIGDVSDVSIDITDSDPK